MNARRRALYPETPPGRVAGRFRGHIAPDPGRPPGAGPILSMNKSSSTLLHKLATALCLLALPVIVAACGGIPGDAVATVDGESITKKQFDHWMTIAAKSGGQQATQIP